MCAISSTNKEYGVARYLETNSAAGTSAALSFDIVVVVIIIIVIIGNVN